MDYGPFGFWVAIQGGFIELPSRVSESWQKDFSIVSGVCSSGNAASARAALLWTLTAQASQIPKHHHEVSFSSNDFHKAQHRHTLLNHSLTVKTKLQI